MLTYEGPEPFEVIVRQIYEAIKQDYDREEVSVAIGIPGCYVWKNETFPTQDYVNPFVAERVAMLDDLNKRKAGQGGTIENEYRRIFDELKTISLFFKYEAGARGCYNTDEDKIFLDPFIFTFFYVSLSKGENVAGQPYDGRSLLQHELVHYCLGNTQAQQFMRKNTAELLRLQQMVLKGAVSKKDVEIPQEIFDKARAAKAELARIHYSIGDDALAYGYLGEVDCNKNREDFLRQVADDSGPGLVDRAEKLFYFLRREILRSTRLRVLQEMRAKMDQAFTERVSVLDLYGV